MNNDFSHRLIRLGEQHPDLQEPLARILDVVTGFEKAAAVSMNGLREFDLVGYDEGDYEEILDELNAVNNTRSAMEAFRKVAEADPGLFEVDVDSPQTTRNEIVSINAGDTYAPTLVFDEGVGGVEYMTWGDAIEAYQRAYYKQNFMDGVSANEAIIEIELQDTDEVDVDKVESIFDSSTVENTYMEASIEPEEAGYREEYGSFYLGGSYTTKSPRFQDFVSQSGATHGELSTYDREIDDVIAEDLETFVRETLGDHGVSTGRVLHTMVGGIDRPEQVDEPDYHHI